MQLKTPHNFILCTISLVKLINLKKRVPQQSERTSVEMAKKSQNYLHYVDPCTLSLYLLIKTDNLAGNKQ